MKAVHSKWLPKTLSGKALIYGDITEGETLIVDTTFIQHNTGQLLYQWQQSTGGEFYNIAGATRASYTLLQADVGSKLRVMIGSSLQLGNVVSNITNTILDVSDTTYTINYDANGGMSGHITSEIVGTGGHPTFVAQPSKEGYILSGWTNAEGDTLTVASVIISDTTLFALWEVKIRYRVTFEMANESVEILTQGYPAFVPYLPELPVQADSVFDIWITARGERFDTSYMVFRDLEVYPAWQVKRFALNVVSLHGGIIYEPQQPDYEIHTTVRLTARPGDRYEFVNWTGDVQSTDTTITVVMDSAINLAANYRELPYYRLDVYPSSTHGEVTKYPNSSRYISGFTVQVTAIPDSGYEFESWSGDYAGEENPLFLTLTKDMEIFANFVQPLDTVSRVQPGIISVFKLVPNPNNGTFKVQSEDPDADSYIIYRMDGTEIQSGKLNSEEIITLTEDTPGIYLLNIHTRFDRTVLKLIVK